MNMDYAKRLEKVLNGVWWHYPFMIEHVIDQVGVTEYSIQRWWADKINLKEKSVNILNSGFGFYSIPFAKERGAVEINTYDMDPMTKEIIMGSNHDLCNIVFDHEDFKQADVWINTSWEHNYPMGDIIPKGTMCIMSSNNLRKRGHINPVNSLVEFKEQLNLSNFIDMDAINFSFEDDEGERKYEQYFVMGIK